MAPALLALGLLVASPLPAEAQRALEQWRAEKDREMRAPTSPLAYQGTRALGAGHNTLGSGAGDTLHFDSRWVPPNALDLVAESGGVTLYAWLPLVSLNGEPLDIQGTAGAKLKLNDVVEVGPLHLQLSGNRQLTVSDIARPEMLAYAGLHYLPVDGVYRVEARFEPAEQGKSLTLDTSQQTTRQLPLVGLLRFELQGQPCTLQAFRLGERPHDLFVIFKDPTNGKQTYGAGRFLWVDAPANGLATVDFNRAWNPLCAYSPSYNCPLAPKENHLPLEIPVGEARYAGH